MENEKQKVLIVEDDKDFRTSLEIIIKKSYNVDIADNLQTALNLINENNYDVVSTDGVFPYVPGGQCSGHVNGTDYFYNGSAVAEAAKEKGAYVIGVTSEPDKLKGTDYNFNKNGMNILGYIAIIDKYCNQNKLTDFDKETYPGKTKAEIKDLEDRMFNPLRPESEKIDYHTYNGKPEVLYHDEDGDAVYADKNYREPYVPRVLYRDEDGDPVYDNPSYREPSKPKSHRDADGD